MQVKYNGLTIESPTQEIQTNASRQPFGRLSAGGGLFTAVNYTFAPALRSGKRDVWYEAGYKEQLDFHDHFSAFERTMGRIGITFIPTRAWMMRPTVKDGDNTDTQFCKDVQVLIDEHDLWDSLYHLQVFSRVYQYGGMIISVREDAPKRADQPIERITGGVKGIERIMPVMQDRVESYGVERIEGEENFGDPRYGLPKYYRYRENSLSDNQHTGGTQFNLDPSRVFIHSDNATSGTIYGEPINQAGFNYILNIEKIIAASGEGIWKNAQQTPWVTINDKDNAAQILSNSKVREAFDEATKRAASGIDPQRMIVGGDVKTLQSTLTDPTKAFMVALQSYAATIDGVPASALIGHQLGERASSNDDTKVNAIAKSYQTKKCDKMIKGFFNHLIKLGGLTPPTDKICIEWPDLDEPTESQKLESMEKKYKMNEIAYKTGMDAPFPDVNENRKNAGYEEIEVSERFSE